LLHFKVGDDNLLLLTLATSSIALVFFIYSASVNRHYQAVL